SEIFSTADWTTLPYLGHGPGWSGRRLYACKCLALAENDETALDEPTEDSPLIPWRCAGHPFAVEGQRFYGIEVRVDMDWHALVSKAFAGWHPPEVHPEKEPPSQAIWLRYLYRRLAGTPMSALLSQAAAQCLTHSAPLVRAIALRFFYDLTSSPG